MQTADAAWKFLEHSDPVASAAQVDTALDALAQQIADRFAGAFPLVLALMQGAMVFAGRLLPRLRFPLELDYVHVTRYGAQTQGGDLRWRVAPTAAVKGRAVLALDDILDGGHTLCAVRDRVLELGAASFHCAVLVEKRLACAKPIAADFVGLQVPDRFVFGCGMDARGLWRNLPEIRALRES